MSEANGDEAPLAAVGSVVWAKLRSFPWWPAVVDDAAGASTELRASRPRHAPRAALVRFLGPTPSLYALVLALCAFGRA